MALNDCVELIRNDYRTKLNRIQENDDSQINFMKYTMQKFAQIVGKVGEDLCDQCMTMHDASQMINSATDIKIFIEYNKSTNLVVAKEKFQEFKMEAPRKSILDYRQANAPEKSSSALIFEAPARKKNQRTRSLQMP